MKSSERVVLVGNGPSALDRDAGERIDEFDIVVRFNDYVIEGFERQVGRRTDVWAVAGTPKTWRRAAEVPVVLLSYPYPRTDHYDELWRQAETVARQLMQVDAQTFSETMSLFGTDLEREGTAICHPTTGALVCWWFLKRHGRVWIHGFDHFERAEHHYFETRRVTREGLQWHDPAAEHEFFDHLERMGRVARL